MCKRYWVSRSIRIAGYATCSASHLQCIQKSQFHLFPLLTEGGSFNTSITHLCHPLNKEIQTSGTATCSVRRRNTTHQNNSFDGFLI